MRRKVWLIALATVLLAATLGGGAYWYWVNSPRYALQQMALSLKTRNMDNLFKYVDLKAIFNSFLDDADAVKEPPAGQKEDEWTQLTRQMGRKFSRALLPKLFDAFESQIRAVIEQYLANLNNTQILGVAAAVTTAQIEREANEARVTLVDPRTQDQLRFEMHRSEKSGIWRIAKVNYQDIQKVYKRLF